MFSFSLSFSPRLPLTQLLSIFFLVSLLLFITSNLFLLFILPSHFSSSSYSHLFFPSLSFSSTFPSLPATFVSYLSLFIFLLFLFSQSPLYHLSPFTIFLTPHTSFLSPSCCLLCYICSSSLSFSSTLSCIFLTPHSFIHLWLSFPEARFFSLSSSSLFTIFFQLSSLSSLLFYTIFLFLFITYPHVPLRTLTLLFLLRLNSLFTFPSSSLLAPNPLHLYVISSSSSLRIPSPLPLPLTPLCYHTRFILHSFSLPFLVFISLGFLRLSPHLHPAPLPSFSLFFVLLFINYTSFSFPSLPPPEVYISTFFRCPFSFFRSLNSLQLA